MRCRPLPPPCDRPSTVSATGGRRPGARASTSSTWSPTRSPWSSCSPPASGWSARSPVPTTSTATPWWCSTPSTGRPTPAGASPGTPRACARSTARGRGRRWSSTSPPGSGSRRYGAGGHAAGPTRSSPPGARSWGRRSSASPAALHGPEAGGSSGRSVPPPSTCAASPAVGWTATSTRPRPATARGTTWARCSCAGRRGSRWPTARAGSWWCWTPPPGAGRSHPPRAGRPVPAGPPLRRSGQRLRQR
jgi:hypothetical protein